MSEELNTPEEAAPNQAATTNRKTDSLENLYRRLQEAEEALHRLSMGELEVTVSVVGYGATSYHHTNQAQLSQYIARLQQRIDRLSQRPRRGPILMRF